MWSGRVPPSSIERCGRKADVTGPKELCCGCASCDDMAFADSMKSRRASGAGEMVCDGTLRGGADLLPLQNRWPAAFRWGCDRRGQIMMRRNRAERSTYAGNRACAPLLACLSFRAGRMRKRRGQGKNHGAEKAIKAKGRGMASAMCAGWDICAFELVTSMAAKSRAAGAKALGQVLERGSHSNCGIYAVRAPVTRYGIDAVLDGGGYSGSGAAGDYARQARSCSCHSGVGASLLILVRSSGSSG